MKRIRKPVVIITALTVVFTAAICIFAVHSSFAASGKPSRVRSLKVTSKTYSTVSLKWSKAGKNVSGYAVYRNGKLIRRLGKKSTKYTDKGLKESTKYKYTVRAYRKYKKKGGKKTAYIYGKRSPAVKVTTKKKPVPQPDPDSFTYSENPDGTLSLTKYNGRLKRLAVPSEIDGHQVSAIGDSCFAGNANLIEVAVPEGIKTIGDYSFECVSGLKNVSLPGSLESIGDGCFSGCGQLEAPVLREGIKRIGSGAFLFCTSVTEITLPESLEELGKFAFSGCSSIKSAVLNGKGLSVIPDRTFCMFGDEGSSALSSVTLSPEIRTAGKRAFSGCRELKSVEFTGDLDKIDSYAFESCDQLKKVSFNGHTTIEKFAFTKSYSLNKLTIPKETEKICEGAFAGSGISSVELLSDKYTLSSAGNGDLLLTADGTTLLAYLAPQDSDYVSVTVPEGVEVIGAYAFSMAMIDNVTLPKGLKEIHEYAFSDTRISRNKTVIPEGCAVDKTAFNEDEQEEDIYEDSTNMTDDEASSDAVEKAFREIALNGQYSDYSLISDSEFDGWSRKYIEYNKENCPMTDEMLPYVMMYKGEVIPYFIGMSAAHSGDPERMAEAADTFGDDFADTFIMMDHGLDTELSRGRIPEDIIVYSGVYDSEQMLAAGTDHIPSLDELKAAAAEGRVFTDGEMISTSTSAAVSCNFSDTLFIIYASKDALDALGSICIDSFLQSNEKEILLHTGARFKVFEAGSVRISSSKEKRYIKVKLQ